MSKIYHRKQHVFSILLIWLLVISFPLVLNAEDALVTCTGLDCEFCDLISTGQRVLNWLVGVLTILAVLLFAYAGLILVTSLGNRTFKQKAFTIFNNVIIGYLLVLAGWLLVDTTLKALANQELFAADGAIGPWNRIECVDQPHFVSDPDVIDLDPSPDGQLCFENGTCLTAYDADDIVGSEYYNYPDGFTPPDGFVNITEIGNPQISENFRFCDLTNCNDDQRRGDYVYLDPRAVAAMDEVANQLGQDLTITSGFRSPGYNDLVSTSLLSTHQQGIAFDIAHTGGLTGEQIQAACNVQGAGYVYSGSNFTHCDWR